MRRGLLFSLFVVMCPFISHADVIYSQTDHSTDIYEAGSAFSLMQGAFLGQGLEGELQTMKVWTSMVAPSVGLIPTIYITVVCYDDSSYRLYCGEITSDTVSTVLSSTNANGVESTLTFPAGFVFDPTKYYRYRINRSNGSGLHAFGITSPDTCEDDNSIGKCTGTPYVIIEGDVNAAPTLSGLGQFRQFGIDVVAEGATFVGNEAVFRGDVADDSALVKLEVEVKPTSVTFDGSGVIASELAPVGELSVAHSALIPVAEHYMNGGNEKSFHWRARAVDEQGKTSEWQEFGSDSLAADFAVKVVPLWTQVDTNFPVRADEVEWADSLYASGVDADCGDEEDNFKATVGTCGCAITSAVMLAHYYDLERGMDGSNVTPLFINAWLKQNNGYIGNNFLSWNKVQQYLGQTINGKAHSWFALETVSDGTGGRTHKITNKVVLDGFLADSAPVIAFDNRVGHYFLIDNKVNRPGNTATYALRDPFWYETRILDETAAVPERVRRYGNQFSYGTVLTKLSEPRIVAAHTEFYLASPAELLITDPQGRRVGKDPTTGVVYSEIPDALYYLDDPISTSETELDPSSVHHVKVLELPVLSDGNYVVQVIGTGSGAYTLTSMMTDGTGSTSITAFNASTTPNEVTEYELVVMGGEPQETTPAAPSVPVLIEELKVAIKQSNAKSLIKAALLLQVVAIEKTYEKGKNKEAKLVVIALEKEVTLLKKKKQISSVDADKILALLSELKNML